MQHGWNLPRNHSDKDRTIGSKFKNLRRVLKAWKNQLPNLAKGIQNCKEVILFLDNLEEIRDLAVHEWNFRTLVVDHLHNLLNQQRIYWKQRETIKMGQIWG